METRIIIATKHNTRRNDARTSMYWSISESCDSEWDDDGCLRSDIINLNWLHSKLPKRIKDVLETSGEDKKGFGLKQSKFKISIKEISEYGGFKFGDIIEIKKI